MQHPLSLLLSPITVPPKADPNSAEQTQKSVFLTQVLRLAQRLFRQNFTALGAAWQTLREDFQIIFERDPAARHGLEVIFCYPGFHALVLHRFAHWLHKRRVTFLPRLISHLGRFLTGIEIHPGAAIGKGVFIDHGMGVVIGETAIVGDYCLIYQEVTLGGTGKEVGKRHPTLGQHVVVGAGAKILGNIQVGDFARVGAGSIVLRDVPSQCTTVGVPGRNICRTNTQICPLEHGQVPDVEAAVLRTLLDRIETLEQHIQQLTHGQTVTTHSQTVTSHST